ncbi:helix-turn-helix domain-containing protein [Pseudoalteromonas sp.]|uniref:helix-turn-helix domain-containing protein n=1 Tax=Pseudoalteromonas sp. TaxID=53249 RepID=UPI003567642B
MSLTQKVTGDAIGAYKYLIGLGTVATCNCYWLLSRSFFRQEKVIEHHHLALAFAISLLIFINQGYLFASSSHIIASSSDSVFRHVLSEITVLLSSCVLVLSFWEGCRDFKTATKQDKAQRILFLSTFGLAVGISKLTNFTLASNADAKEWVITAIILMVVVNTQLLLAWRVQHKSSDTQPQTKASSLEEIHTQPEPVCDIDNALARDITSLMNEGSLYLQANLKVADIARSLDVPEYRVSRALKSYITDKNFNQYINSLRVEHAKSLLINPENQGWSVLVISLESGFASIGPFTRAFKAETGLTPKQFRQMHVSKGLVKLS